MKPVSQKMLMGLLDKAAIAMVPPELGIGRQLTYEPSAKRTFVIQFEESHSAEEVQVALAIILSSCEGWTLVERHARDIQAERSAVQYGHNDQDRLVEDLGSIQAIGPQGRSDLYRISNDGKTMVTWDHHTSNEGLVVQFNDVGRSNEVLMDLNRVGTEMDLFFTP